MSWPEQWDPVLDLQVYLSRELKRVWKETSGRKLVDKNSWQNLKAWILRKAEITDLKVKKKHAWICSAFYYCYLCII